MILMEDIGGLLPNHRTGKIVGIASMRGEYLVVACEHGLFKLWEDGTGIIQATETSTAETVSARSTSGDVHGS
jgi:hypothetical protein